jgi:hypothetical protein
MKAFRKGIIFTICLTLVFSFNLYGQKEKKLTLDQMRMEIARQSLTFKVGKTSVSDVPLENLCGLVEPPDWRDQGNFDGGCKGELTLPSSWDWRVYDVVTQVQNQLDCGSCWAFATIGSYEGCVAVARCGRDNLSTQWLLDCNTLGYSCEGGWWGFPNLYDSVPLENCYPYVGIQGTCQTGCPKYHPMKEWFYVGTSSGVPSTTDIKAALYEHGPIAAAVHVDSYFQNYTEGIFTHTSTNAPNHGVLLVGWDDNEGYWILKNSWGSEWGELGCMRIAYGANNIGYAAAYGVPVFPCTVGNTDVFESISFNAHRRAMPSTMPDLGWIESVTIYHNGGFGSMLLGVYDGEGSRLGITEITPVSRTTGWQTLMLTNPVRVWEGNTVWLAWVYQINPGIRYQTGSPGRYQSGDTWFGGMPDPFGSSSQENYIYSIYASYLGGDYKTVGSIVEYGNTSTQPYRRAMPFTMPEDGSVTSVAIYHNGGTGSMILAVYEGEDSPQNRLGITEITPVSGTPGWQKIDLINEPSFLRGTTIWLAWVYENNPGIRYQIGSPGRYQSCDTWSSGMPYYFGSGSQENYIYSIFAIYKED